MATLKVLTFNVWGLHYLACRVRERLVYIAKELKRYDIVALQEVWSEEDFAFLVKELDSSLQHSHYFHTAVIGSGLCVFSRYPIVSAFGHQFSVTGGVRRFLDGEIFAGKGVLGCKIKTPEGNLGLYTTHLNPKCRDSQLFEIYQFIERTRGREPVILTGDFNTSRYKHISFDLMTKCLGLQDAFEDSPQDTCDLKSNIYTKKGIRPKRIDFILFSDELSDRTSLRLQGKKLCLTGHIPGKDFPYSDHEGVEASFALEQREKPLEVQERVLDDEAVEVLMGVAKNVSTKRAPLETSPSTVMKTKIILFLVCFTCALIFSNQWLFSVLAQYYLHWAGTVITGLLVAWAVFRVFCMHSDIQLYNTMTANLTQIRIILKYNHIERGLEDSVARHDFVV